MKKKLLRILFSFVGLMFVAYVLSVVGFLFIFSKPQVDLSDRKKDLDIITRWRPADFEPNCRANYEETLPERYCGFLGHATMQYMDGPNAVPRSEQKIEGLDLSDLPNVFVNLTTQSYTKNEHTTLSERCTAEVVGEMLAWMEQTPEIQRNDVITVTDLSPDEPWFYCLHDSRRDWDRALSKGQIPELTKLNFWLWRSGRIIGWADCSRVTQLDDGRLQSPQCGIDLWWGRGNFKLVIGGSLNAIYFRDVLESLGPKTQRFFDIHSDAIRPYAFDRGLVNVPVELTQRADQQLKILEEMVK